MGGLCWWGSALPFAHGTGVGKQPGGGDSGSGGDSVKEAGAEGVVSALAFGVMGVADVDQRGHFGLHHSSTVTHAAAHDLQALGDLLALLNGEGIASGALGHTRCFLSCSGW